MVYWKHWAIGLVTGLMLAMVTDAAHEGLSCIPKNGLLAHKTVVVRPEEPSLAASQPIWERTLSKLSAKLSTQTSAALLLCLGLHAVGLIIVLLSGHTQ